MAFLNGGSGEFEITVLSAFAHLNYWTAYWIFTHNDINIMLLKDILAKYFLIFYKSDDNVTGMRNSEVVKTAETLNFKSWNDIL